MCVYFLLKSAIDYTILYCTMQPDTILCCTIPYRFMASGPEVYLWPEKPPFLGFLIMVSIYNFLKRSVLGGQTYGSG